MNYISSGLVWMALGALLGCGHSDGFMPLNRAALRVSGPATILSVEQLPPRFDGLAAKSVFASGILPALAAAAVVGSMYPEVKPDRIADPAIFIRDEIEAAMAKRFALESVPANRVDKRLRWYGVYSGGKPPPVDLLLDIRTTYWGIVATGNRRFGAKYNATLRLTDLRTGEVVALGVCEGNSIDAQSPTLYQLREDGAALATTMIRVAARFCLDDFRKRVLGLY